MQYKVRAHLDREVLNTQLNRAELAMHINELFVVKSVVLHEEPGEQTIRRGANIEFNGHKLNIVHEIETMILDGHYYCREVYRMAEINDHREIYIKASDLETILDELELRFR